MFFPVKIRGTQIQIITSKTLQDYTILLNPSLCSSENMCSVLKIQAALEWNNNRQAIESGNKKRQQTTRTAGPIKHTSNLLWGGVGAGARERGRSRALRDNRYSSRRSPRHRRTNSNLMLPNNLPFVLDLLFFRGTKPPPICLRWSRCFLRRFVVQTSRPAPP